MRQVSEGEKGTRVDGGSKEVDVNHQISLYK